MVDFLAFFPNVECDIFLPLTTKRVLSFEEYYAHQCFVNQIKTGEKKGSKRQMVLFQPLL